jgi:hypothetical protein
MARFMPANTGGNFEMAPGGTHIAVCYRYVDLGTQDGSYQGKPRKAHKVMITWELVDEKMADGRPFSISKTYTLSSHEKSGLRKDLEAWRGAKFTDEEIQRFDLSTLMGKPCMLNVVHNDKGEQTYANVGGIMRLPKGSASPARVNETIFFDLDARPFDAETYAKLGERLRETIAKSPEYKAAHGEHSEANPPPHDGNGIGDPDDPFGLQ